MSSGLWCPKCGGEMIGDGYRDPLRCEFAADDDAPREPDAAPQYCDFSETNESESNEKRAQPAPPRL